MKKWLVAATALGAAAFGSVSARADSLESQFSWVPAGVYIRGEAGVGFGQGTNFQDSVPTNSTRSSLGTAIFPSSPGNSPYFGAAIGYRFTPLFRMDFSLDYLSAFKVNGSTTGGLIPGITWRGSGDLTSTVGMLNAYLDLNPLVKPWYDLGPFQPFIDGGIGFASNRLGTLNGSLNVLGTIFPGTLSGSTTTNFAWGIGAGVGYAITPQLTLELAYKYLDLGTLSTGTYGSGFPPSIIGSVNPLTVSKSGDLDVHTVSIGLRFAFGAPAAPPPALATPPAPPPPVAAAPAPSAQKFIVFFDFDKSTLTADGAKVVDAAAAAFKSGKTGVSIAGYTDRAGTPAYNLALSKRRADTVKAALVKDGVPASKIDESWHGEDTPRVPTADGVREPQNRRVEVAM